jgi:aspartate aminotransferase
MTGWRIGYGGAPAALTKAMDKLQSQSTSNPSSISQAASLEALSGPQDSVAAMARTYEQRRDIVVGALNAMPGVVCHKPEGAFYVYPSMQGCLGRVAPNGVTITTDEDFVTALLDAEGVATVHGSAFMFPGHFRISYALDTASLQQACERIARFVNALV